MVNIYDTYNTTHKTKYICQCEILINIPNFNVNIDNNDNDPMPMYPIVCLCSCLQLYNCVRCEDYITKFEEVCNKSDNIREQFAFVQQIG